MNINGTLTKAVEADDGTLEIEGIASTESQDDQGDIVTAEAMRSAVAGYMEGGTGALREMHQLTAAGRVDELVVGKDGITRIKALVVDPVAVKKIKTGVYRGLSIGGKVMARDSKTPKKITKIRLSEISLVDRGSNPDAVLTLVKADDERPAARAERAITALEVLLPALEKRVADAEARPLPPRAAASGLASNH